MLDRVGGLFMDARLLRQSAAAHSPALTAFAVQFMSGLSGHGILAGCAATISGMQPGRSASEGYRHHGSGVAKAAMTARAVMRGSMVVKSSSRVTNDGQ